MVERFNPKILEMIRCMLVNVGLKKVFWAEAVMTSKYLINRCHSTALRMKIPEEFWSGHPPDLDKRIVFSYVAYAHIRQDKIEPRAKRCMFMGYSTRGKTNKLCYLESCHKRYITSCNDVFYEAEIAFKKSDDVGRNIKIS